MKATLVTAAAVAIAALGHDGKETAVQDMQQMQELAQPGPEHERLIALEGNWEASGRPLVAGAGAEGGRGTGRARALLGGRFVEVELNLASGLITEAVFVLGFDRRHDHYTVSYMDDTGTYGVAAVGKNEEDTIVMHGVDDDPVMTSMGLTKEFVIALSLPDIEADTQRVTIEIRFIDTRTSDRTQMPFYEFELTRSQRPTRRVPTAQ